MIADSGAYYIDYRIDRPDLVKMNTVLRFAVDGRLCIGEPVEYCCRCLLRFRRDFAVVYDFQDIAQAPVMMLRRKNRLKFRRPQAAPVGLGDFYLQPFNTKQAKLPAKKFRIHPRIDKRSGYHIPARTAKAVKIRYLHNKKISSQKGILS
jgi:hypothetical protein